jgi:hypothetical protein
MPAEAYRFLLSRRDALPSFGHEGLAIHFFLAI